MVRTIVQGNLTVYDRITSQYTGLHGATDTVVNSGDVFLGNRTADDGVDKLVTLAALVGLNLDLNMTVLALTTGLTGVLVIHISQLANGFLVGYLGLTNIGLYLEFTQQTVNDDFQMQLTHTSDNGLTGFLIGIGLEGGVLFGELRQSDCHLL